MGALKAVFLTGLITFALGVLLAFYLYGTQYQVVSSEGKAYKVNRMTGDAWLLAIGGQRKVGKGQPLCFERFIVERKKKQKTEAKPKITSRDERRVLYSNNNCLAEIEIMEKAKIVKEETLATIKKNGKTIVDQVMVEFITEKFSSKQKVLHGRFNLPSGTPLWPSFYKLVMEDGRSYQIVVKGNLPRGEKVLVSFLVVPEE